MFLVPLNMVQGQKLSCIFKIIICFTSGLDHWLTMLSSFWIHAEGCKLMAIAKKPFQPISSKEFYLTLYTGYIVDLPWCIIYTNISELVTPLGSSSASLCNEFLKICDVQWPFWWTCTRYAPGGVEGWKGRQ